MSKITCVTAPSRSGTSLTMQMLQAAGVPLCWNVLPNRSVFNPFGHYEFRGTDLAAHLHEMYGKAVKVMPFDLDKLTPDHEYRFITIIRNADDANRSQVAAAIPRGGPMADEGKTAEWQEYTLKYIKNHENVVVCFYELFNGEAQRAIGQMMGFDELQIAKMNDCVDPTLWHFKQ